MLCALWIQARIFSRECSFIWIQHVTRQMHPVKIPMHRLRRRQTCLSSIEHILQECVCFHLFIAGFTLNDLQLKWGFYFTSLCVPEELADLATVVATVKLQEHVPPWMILLLTHLDVGSSFHRRRICVNREMSVQHPSVLLLRLLNWNTVPVVPRIIFASGEGLVKRAYFIIFVPGRKDESQSLELQISYSY